jgi:hypothetical protein
MVDIDLLLLMVLPLVTIRAALLLWTGLTGAPSRSRAGIPSGVRGSIVDAAAMAGKGIVHETSMDRGCGASYVVSWLAKPRFPRRDRFMFD